MSAAAAREALRAGRPDEARARLVEAIRVAPGDAALRSFMFQLSCVTGDWPAAMRALDVLATLDPEALGLVADYRAAIAAEATRRAVFAGEAAPSVFGDRAPWTADLARALRLDATGEAEAAAEARARALEAAPAEPGTADGTAFAWIADADTRLGPVLEVVMNGAYRWLPFCEIARLEITPPRDLRDTVWAVAVLTIAEGAQWPLLVPARYPGSEAAGAPLALGRETVWRDLVGGHAAGLGQRVLGHDSGEIGLLDLRTLTFDRPAADTAVAG